MSFKNTMKLFASNFSLVWKQVLYFFVCFILILILSLQIARPIIEIFKINGVTSEVGNLVDSIYALQNSAYFSFFDIIRHILNLIAINFKEIYLNLILLILVAFLIPYILFQMSIYNLSSIVYKKLSMNMNVSYIQNFLGCFKESILYALTNIVLSLPFWAVKILFLELYLTLSSNPFISYIGMVVLSALFILLDSVKTALFTCYTGYYIEHNKLPFNSFSNSIPLISGKFFWNLLSSCILIQLILIVANGFVGLFTFFAGLVVTIPAIFVLIFNPTKYIVKQDENPVHYLTMEEPVEVVEEQVITSVSKKKDKKFKYKKKKKN